MSVGETKKLRAAAIVQLIGALPATMIFFVNLWNFYIDRRNGLALSNDDIRTFPWIIAPLSLLAALALLTRHRIPWLLCFVLAVTWPLVPTADLLLLKGSLHGGEIFLMLMVPLGLGFAALTIIFLWKGRPELV